MSPGTLLFRYRSVAGESGARSGEIITKSELYFANPLSFNDPFDCRPVFQIKAENTEIKRYYDGVLKRQAAHLNREARRAEAKRVAVDKDRKLTNPQNLEEFKRSYDSTVTARVGMLCLSEVPDDPLMWSHYADSHRGICLAFDWRDPFFAAAQQVRYAKQRPAINPVFHDNETMLEHALLTKSDHWSYEREWRIVHYRRGSGAYAYPVKALKAIVVGHQATPATRQQIAKWAKDRRSPVPVYEARISTTEFKIHIVPPLSYA